MRRDRKREPHVHPTRVTLDRRVDELPDPGKLDDVVQLALDLAPLHSEDRPVEEDVLAPGELRVEARAHLEQAADAATDDRTPRRRCRDARQHLEQRRLAGPVPSDDSEDLALVDVEAHVPESPDLLLLIGIRAACEARPQTRDRIAERPVGGLHLADAVPLRELLCLDRDRHQIVSAKRGSDARKTVSPIRNSAIPTAAPTPA